MVTIGVAALVITETASQQQRHQGFTGFLGTVLSFGGIFLYAMVVWRFRQHDEQSQRLLTQMEETRDAELRAAALAERQRLAREMHDVLAHSLSGLVVQLEGARLLALSDPADGRLATTIDRAHQLAKSGLDEARRAIGMLRDDELPGPDKLAALARSFEADSGIPCRYTETGQPVELRPAVKLALYRVTQEALTNIRKHAHPERVEIHLEYLRDGVSLAVEDFVGRRGQARARRGHRGLRRRLRAHRHARARRTARRDPDRGTDRLRLSRRTSSACVSNPRIRVLAVDDQRVVREGLAMLLGLLPDVEVVGTAADGEEALTLAGELRPDVILMDLRMPRVDGVEATRRLRASHPEIKVVVLTTYADDRSVIDALRAGALGYLTKDAGADEIRQALQRVASGQASLDPAVQMHLVEAIATTATATTAATTDVTSAPPASQLPDGLTPREAEVLGLIGAGLSNTEIAAQLFVSEATVKSHVNHMLPKIGARDRAQAVGYAYRHGLVPPGPVRR